jgi:hypothetical protein
MDRRRLTLAETEALEAELRALEADPAVSKAALRVRDLRSPGGFATPVGPRTASSAGNGPALAQRFRALSRL